MKSENILKEQQQQVKIMFSLPQGVAIFDNQEEKSEKIFTNDNYNIFGTDFAEREFEE